MDKYLDARLRLIDSGLTAVLQRQGIIASMIVAARATNVEQIELLQIDMLAALEKHENRIKKIMKDLTPNDETGTEGEGGDDERHD